MTVDEHDIRPGRAQDGDDLLTRWLATAADVGTGSELPTVDRGAPVPASPSQRGLWLAQEIEGDAAKSFATWHCYRLVGTLDVPALARALDLLVERHEVLRTGFQVRGSELLQQIYPRYPLGLTAEPPPAVTGTASDGPQAGDDRTALLGAAVATALEDPLDLVSGRVMRARLFRVEDGEHILVLILHHIAVDGASMSVLHRDLADLYEGECGDGSGGPEPLRHHYLDFAEWQRLEAESGVYDEGVEFWRTALDGMAHLVPLPTDRRRPATQSYRGEWLLFPVPEQVVDRVGAIARGAGATPHMVTLAAFVAVLARWTAQADLIVGTAVNHRPLPEAEEMVGPFASILPVPYTVDASSTFRSHLAGVKERILEARAHENVPLELILGALGVAHRPGHNPLVQVTMTYKTGVIEEPRLGGVAMTGQTLAVADGFVQRDLALEIIGERGDTLVVGYASDLWDASSIRSLAAAYLHALSHWTGHPDEPLDALDLALPDPPVRELPDADAAEGSNSGDAVAAAAGADRTHAESADSAGNADDGDADDPDNIGSLVRRAWLEVLEVPAVQPADDFFELGGESLGAMRVCSRIGVALGGRVPLRVLYENSELRDFTTQVRARAEAFGPRSVTT